MQRGTGDLQPPSYSWWLESHNNRPNQAQWLQTTISDFDKKTKIMVNLIEEDGDTFAKRAEMYYKKRPELIKMVEELHRSFRALADNYDQLRCEWSQLPPPPPLLLDLDRTSNNPSGQATRHLQKPKNENPENGLVDLKISHSKKVLQDPTNPGNMMLETLDDHAEDELITNNMTLTELKKKIDVKWDGIKCDNGSLVRDKAWNHISKVSKLIEMNLQQQAKLIMRNEEKREAIKNLCAKVDRLMNENVALKTALSQGNKTDVKQNKSQITKMNGIIKMKGAIFGKFLR